MGKHRVTRPHVETPRSTRESRTSPPKIAVKYQDKTIFKAKIKTDLNKIHYGTVVDDSRGLVNQVMAFTAKDLGIEMTGEIAGSEESFPCESDRKPEGFDIVRHSYGLSQSLLNRAVYDRKWDWVLFVDHYGDAIIKPTKSTSRSRVSI